MASDMIFARDLTELHQVLNLMPRDSVCVSCDSNSSLGCSCDENHECQFTIPSDCTQCAQAICTPIEDPDAAVAGDDGDSGPDPGAIAGGVVGGLAAIAILSYLVWRFVVKPRRSLQTQSIYEPASIQSHDAEKDAGSRLTRRSSTHTVHSIASTVLTRASNIIQIAYIPGVTNRATPTSPNVLVPPVPPIPMHHAEGGRDLPPYDQHFFVPGDLRGSTYSGYSGYSDRTSYAHTSYAPRSSVASTIYGKQAQVLTPASMGMRAKPTMVSVKSYGSSSAGSAPNTPPVPQVDFEKYQPQGNSRPKSGASAFSVGSAFLNNANTAQVVKMGGLKKIDIAKSPDGAPASAYTSSPDAPELPTTRNTRQSAAVTIIEDSPTLDQGPFSDPPSRPTLGAVEEDDESSRDGRSSRPTTTSSTQRGTSPFGDQHAVRTP